MDGTPYIAFVLNTESNYYTMRQYVWSSEALLYRNLIGYGLTCSECRWQTSNWKRTASASRGFIAAARISCLSGRSHQSKVGNSLSEVVYKLFCSTKLSWPLIVFTAY